MINRAYGNDSAVTLRDAFGIKGAREADVVVGCVLWPPPPITVAMTCRVCEDIIWATLGFEAVEEAVPVRILDYPPLVPESSPQILRDVVNLFRTLNAS